MAKRTKTDEPASSAPAAKLYTTLAKAADAELTEKKSVFIGHASPAKTEAEAVEFIAKMRKQYADARHNVYAYYLNGGGIARYSDDSEPQGTAGVPVLDVIRKSGADNCVIVVTRYFGGILLGAGGLVRAYSAAAKLALDSAGIVSYEPYCEFELRCDYSAYQRITAECPKHGVIIDGTEFGSEITLHLAVKSTRYAALAARLSEMFAGRITPKPTGERYDFM